MAHFQKLSFCSISNLYGRKFRLQVMKKQNEPPLNSSNRHHIITLAF